MILRSLLFVPADSEKKLAKARNSPADALILDLEDSVSPESRANARALACEFLKEKHAQSVWVRINPVGSANYRAELADVAAAAPAGLVVPKADSPDALRVLDRDLTVVEKARGLPQGGLKVIPVASETPLAVLNLMDYRVPPPRLAALTWGAEDLSAALGAASNHEADGEFSFIYKIVRSLALIAAKAAGVAAIETLHADFRDAEGLERIARKARRDGFTGMLAIHPDQVKVINAAFTPSFEEVAQAERIVAAFADGAGVASLGGRMLDAPHLKQARNLLALADVIAASK
jgi:citrate lyase subunit beta/citryl-CoA lyase